jgi:hypothetical protein
MIKAADVAIYDLLGKKYPALITDISLNNGVEIDMSGFAKGMYLVKVSTPLSEKIFNVVKQ